MLSLLLTLSKGFRNWDYRLPLGHRIQRWSSIEQTLTLFTMPAGVTVSDYPPVQVTPGVI